jgi:hypothetical protein
MHAVAVGRGCVERVQRLHRVERAHREPPRDGSAARLRRTWHGGARRGACRTPARQPTVASTQRAGETAGAMRGRAGGRQCVQVSIACTTHRLSRRDAVLQRHTALFRDQLRDHTLGPPPACAAVLTGYSRGTLGPPPACAAVLMGYSRVLAARRRPEPRTTGVTTRLDRLVGGGRGYRAPRGARPAIYSTSGDGDDPLLRGRVVAFV